MLSPTEKVAGGTSASDVRAATDGRKPGWFQPRRLAPYLVGAAMFALAIWVLHRTLSHYRLSDIQAELAALDAHQVVLAVLFTALSFTALVGYEFSSLRLIGRGDIPLRKMSLASFVTQSIAHSTGFAPFIGATLRYQFYARRGLTVLDVAKIQILFTVTFTLGVATLAGAVLLIEPTRLAAVTHLPAWVLRLGGAAALALVGGYLAWGTFYHRPLTVRGRSIPMPAVGSTLFQILCGVADLLAVAGALYILLPADLGLPYLTVLAIFMAAIVAGLMSHVPGSLGVLETAIILLIQPTEAQTLPLVGALLAFRACYYILPLVCGVLIIAVHELVRWRGVLGRPFRGGAGR